MKKNLTDFSELLAEWNYKKNNIDPKTLTKGSVKIVWWICKNNHEWQASMNNRTKGSGCPYCSGRMPIIGQTDLLSVNPKLAQEWNYEKNGNLKPSMVTAYSGKKVWWKCDKGHEWQASIGNRKNNGCPYCSGKSVIIGKNDLSSVNPKLAQEWNYEKNHDLKPSMVTAYSGKKVWWKCDKGHEWQASIGNRNRNKGCPYCSGRKAVTGENDFLTLNPQLSQEWNYEKNHDLKPNMVSPNSNKKVWWKCDKGHEWQSTITSRNRGNGCPYCSGRLAIIGENDLSTLNPQLSQEWNYEKNIDLKPSMVSPNSNKKVWWKCNKGHEWQASIYSRNNNSGCPYCSSELQTSFPEQAIYFYLKKIFPDAINRDNHLGLELDIYIPSKKVAIEYDGIFWHKDKKRDERKNKYCKENKITLFRIKENTEDEILDDEYLKILPCTYSDKGIEKAIIRLLSLFNKKIDVNIDKDRASIYASFISLEKERSLSVLNESVALEWNYKKNGDLKPSMVSANSNKKVWWKCNKNHEWQASINNRNKGIGCPYCSGRFAIIGENDLLTLNPQLSQEWNFEKNSDLKPSMVSPNSNKKVWWKCNKGHEWQATIVNRNKGNGCPYCSGRLAIIGETDLLTLKPKLASEWDNNKNQSLKPSMFTLNSSKKVWWKCNKDHEWLSPISHRNKGTGCPYCTNKKVLKGFNDLETTNSELLNDWDYEKNIKLGIYPDSITRGSEKKVWWKCSKCGYSWEAKMYNRSKGQGCPQCHFSIIRSNKQI